MTNLFSTLKLRDITLRNRIMMSPMCMYTAAGDGCATPWHEIHYVTRAVGGVGLIVMEATAVQSVGRISPGDLGLWDDAQIIPLHRIVSLIHEQDAVVGVQLAHAGRKAWSRDKGFGLGQPVAPSAMPFHADWQKPKALSLSEIDGIVEDFKSAAIRADKAGVDVVEIHAAHGYLIHEFLSPIANHRTDLYGGDLARRMTLLLRVVDAVRSGFPMSKLLFVRLSATDWVEGGLTIDDTVHIARELRECGVDLIDCSTGGIVPAAPPGVGPGYQVRFAAQVRVEAGIPTGAVGLITSTHQAETILRTEQADLILLGRELLRHPYWTYQAARDLGIDFPWSKQYVRANEYY